LHEEEPSAQKIAELIDLAKKRNIKYVMFETLISPRVSETIAREIGGQTLVLNPIEGLTPEETSRGENWMTIMEQNLQNLRTALECS
jgi:zinc transport system substrate-binding protein